MASNHAFKLTIMARYYTVEEYLALERASEIKHEYFNGRIVPLYREREERPE